MTDAVPYGFCHCGCGEKTNIVPEAGRGYAKGEPRRFRRGHSRRTSPTDYIVAPNGCWVWQRTYTGDGYGCIKVNRKSRRAHRVYYERHVGPIPEGLTLDHLCGNRLCVNPTHLEPVTQAENVRRGRHAKLTLEAASAIRASDESHAALALRYGVSSRTISGVRNGDTWRTSDAEPVANYGERSAA